jgi:riboflavin kinase/FMN adenylyltransferase
VTIGSFEGVHLGHRELIRSLLSRANAKRSLAGLITFSPHPRAVLDDQREGLYLMTLEEKVRLLGELGLDFLAVLPFTLELASVSARDFMMSVREALRMEELWAGPDFALGRLRRGDSHSLKELGDEIGFRLNLVQAFRVNGEVVSSTRIRDLLGKGDVAAAATLLGRYPGHRSPVVKGAGRGKDLGFPTANLSVDPKRVVPARGVYAVLVKISGREFKGVANIGVRPSFDHGQVNIEVHLLDFNEDLYGKCLEVSFVRRLREERKFGSSEELVSQITKDTLEARRILDSLI